MLYVAPLILVISTIITSLYHWNELTGEKSNNIGYQKISHQEYCQHCILLEEYSLSGQIIFIIEAF